MIDLMTPLEHLDKESSCLGINLFIKRDDLFPVSGGGSKGRKSQYILNTRIQKNYDAVVTCGGIHSNHTRATAIRCKQLGLACTIVIHDDKPSTITGNLKLLTILGVRIVYCSMKEISKVMDSEMDRFVSLNLKPFYIWGGGHCNEGALSFFEAVHEIKKQSNINFDFVFHASGTGTTQAGLHCGFKHLFKATNVIGISISRDKERGFKEVQKSVDDFISIKKLSKNYRDNIYFDDNYTLGGVW